MTEKHKNCEHCPRNEGCLGDFSEADGKCHGKWFRVLVEKTGPFASDEVEEVEAIQCSVCGTIFDMVAPESCPECHAKNEAENKMEFFFDERLSNAHGYLTPVFEKIKKDAEACAARHNGQITYVDGRPTGTCSAYIVSWEEEK